MAQVTLDGGASSAALGGQTITYVEQMVAQQVGGCPDTLIESHLTRVLNDFYTRSTAWRDTLQPYTLSLGINEVDLNPVTQNARLQYVLGVYFLPVPTNFPQFLHPSTRPFVGKQPGPPWGYFMRRFDRLQLYPVPDQTYLNALFVYASLVPTTLAAILPDMSYTHHVDGLIAGVLARLYKIPKRPWSDQGLAADNDKIYRREIALARDQANRGYGPSDAPMRVAPFAGRAGSQVFPRASG